MTAGGWVWPVEPPMTRILVIGRAGQLATALAEADWPADVAVACRGREADRSRTTRRCARKR